MWLTNPQCGRGEGRKFRIFLRDNHQGKSSHIYINWHRDSIKALKNAMSFIFWTWKAYNLAGNQTSLTEKLKKVGFCRTCRTRFCKSGDSRQEHVCMTLHQRCKNTNFLHKNGLSQKCLTQKVPSFMTNQIRDKTA